MRSVRSLMFALFFTCLALAAVPAQASKLKVAVSIIPQMYFVKTIGGDLVDVSAMVAPGASPATYEPKPAQMAALAESDIFFSIGVPFESAWLERFRKAAPNTQFIAMQGDIHRMPMGAHHHHDEADHDHAAHEDMHHEGGHAMLDPHVWLAPPLVRVMAENILDALIDADPANTAAYYAGYATLCREINSVDNDILNTMEKAGAAGKTFFIFHPSFGYFAKAYGLHQQAVEAGGKEPGPRDLARLITLAKEKNVKVVFVAPQFSKRSAKTIADAIGGTVQVADPLAADWPANMRAIARAFSQGVSN